VVGRWLERAVERRPSLMARTGVTAVQVLASQEEEREAEARGGMRAELTVAFTDLEDFTSYTAAEGDEAASRLLIGHHKEAGQIVRSRGGRLLKRLGDGLMLSFPEASAAVLACLELGEAAPLPLRAGVHAGSVQVNRDDLIGNVVNVAARLTESAEGRQVLVTQSVRDAAGDLRGVVFDGPYSRTFKGVKEKVPVYLAARHASPCLCRPTPPMFATSPTTSLSQSASTGATSRSA
jgi:adenylate cyclase